MNKICTYVCIQMTNQQYNYLTLMMITKINVMINFTYLDLVEARPRSEIFMNKM